MKELDADSEESDVTKAPIASSLAQLVSKRFKNKLSDEKRKGKLEKYVRLCNCEDLLTPTVNRATGKSCRLERERFEDSIQALRNARTHCSASSTRATARW